MHYSSLQGPFLNSPPISTRQHIAIIECCLSLSTIVTSMRKPDSSLKHEPVAWKQIVFFHGTVWAWTRPAAHCVTCHCNWQPDPKLQLGPLGLFHSSSPPPSLSSSPSENSSQPLHPVMEKPLKPWTACSWFSVQTLEWKLTLLPSLPPPFNQPRSKQAYVRKLCSYWKGSVLYKNNILSGAKVLYMWKSPYMRTVGAL